MKIDRVLIVLGAMFLASALVFVGRNWFAKMLAIVPTQAPEEMTEPIAMLIAGTIALVSLMSASYLTLVGWKEAKQRRTKANGEARS
jgi:hypothetical protein